MSKMKEQRMHTPWHTKAEKVTADGPYLGGIEHTVVDDEGSFIASCGVTLNDDAERHARLIAAAPALLEASRDAYALLAAIRADGYSGDCLPQLDEMLDGDDKEDSSLTKAIAKAERGQ